MTQYRTQPQWDFLLTASRTTLQSYELSRLSHAANLRKEISALLDQWLEESSQAMLARMLMLQREQAEAAPPSAMGGTTGVTVAADSEQDSASVSRKKRSVSYNFLADRTVPLSETHDSV
jgi:hypothetical protein